MLDGFRMATPDEEKLPRYRHDFAIPDELADTFLLYSFLRTHFGKPRSMSWERRKKIESNPKLWKTEALPDDKLQWNYFIKSPHGFLAFSDGRRAYLSWSAYRIVDEQEAEESTWESLDHPRREIPKELQQDVDLFLRHYNEYVRQVSAQNGEYKPRLKYHQGVIILNPFVIHHNNFRYHLKLMKGKIRKFNDHLSPTGRYSGKYDLPAGITHLSSSAFILLMASLDGFINLLYECFLRDQFRQDIKMKKKIERLGTLDKIEMLPVYCVGFKPVVSLRKEQALKITKSLKSYAQLRVLRNRLVHANLFGFRYTNMIEADSFLFYRDDKRDELELYGGYIEDVVKQWGSLLEKAEKDIMDLMRLLLLTMNTRQRTQFRRIARDEWVGYLNVGQDKRKFVREEIY